MDSRCYVVMCEQVAENVSKEPVCPPCVEGLSYTPTCIIDVYLEDINK